MASFSFSDTGWTRPASAGMGGARRTSTHWLGSGAVSGGARSNSPLQLVSRKKLAHSAALWINMDRPFDDALDGAGGLAGVSHPVGAQVILALRVGLGAGLVAVELGDLGLLVSDVVLQLADAPRLDASEQRERRDATEEVGVHEADP